MIYPLLTKRLKIQPLSEADVEEFVKYRQDPDVARFQSWNVDYSREQALDLVTSQAGEVFPTEGSWLQIGMRDLFTNVLIGDLALHALPERKNEYELGFTVASDFQRQGFATEAASKLIETLFETKSASKITANSDARNLGSIRVLQKLGFVAVPERGWTEHFKNELVKVEHFELVKPNH